MQNSVSADEDHSPHLRSDAPATEAGARRHGVDVVRRWIVAYDVSHPKRLRRTARACEEIALRVQESVFEGIFNSAQWRNLSPSLRRHIEPDSDSWLAHPQCQRCQRCTVTLGISERPEERTYWIV